MTRQSIVSSVVELQKATPAFELTRIVNNECTFHINGFQIDTDGRWFHSVGGERESQSVGGGAPSRSLTFTPGCCSGSSSCPPSPTPPSGTSTSTTTKTIPLICPWVDMSHYHTLWSDKLQSTNIPWRTIQCYFDLNWILISWIIIKNILNTYHFRKYYYYLMLKVGWFVMYVYAYQ